MSQSRSTPKVKVDLTDVPETLLWNLYFRASEARRPDSVLSDPRAVELIDAIDYPFEERFGRANPILAQAQALRVRTFDHEIQRFLSRYPDATVVALGEGLETQAWRVDNGQVRWLTVDFPDTARIRRTLLPDSPRQRIISASALGDDWMDKVDTSHAVLVTAQGLLMYFQPSEVDELIERCASRFPGGVMLFDAVPRWFSRRTLSNKVGGREGYQPPPMPWSVNASELARISSFPGVTDLQELPLTSGRGLVFGRVLPLVSRVSSLRRSRIGIVAPWIILRAQFARDPRSRVQQVFEPR